MGTKSILPTLTSRSAFIGLFVLGFALCARGIGKAPTYGWAHPITLSGYLLGALALLLGGQVFFRWRILPVRDDRQALIALLSILGAKVLLAELYPLFQ